MCEQPPGYESLEVLKSKFPLVDTTYESIMPWKLPREGFGDEACSPRVEKTLEGIVERYPGFFFSLFYELYQKSNKLFQAVRIIKICYKLSYLSLQERLLS